MKKLTIICIFSLIIFVGCSDSSVTLGDLMINGDCEVTGNITDMLQELTFSEIEHNYVTTQVISMDNLMSYLAPVYEDYSVCIIASDGFMVKMDAATLGDTYLGYSSQARWEFISDKHPVNSKVKHISEIILVKNDSAPQYDFGVNIVTPTATTNYSVGELLLMNYQSFLKLDGVTSMGEGVDKTELIVMKQKKLIPLEALTDEEIFGVLVMNDKGVYEYNFSEGYIDIADGMINYYVPEENLLITDIEGVMISPPGHTVMDVYDDSLHYLELDQDVLIIFVDGFSYTQYQYLLDHDSDLFFAGLEDVQLANTVFKPVTNAGFAAMICGCPPGLNGVLDRSYRELLVPTIFDIATDIGLKNGLVEGDINILNIATDISLNFDANSDGFTDDDIHATALEKLDDGYDLLMVHYHSLDDYGHLYGGINDQIFDRLTVIDGYVEELVAAWAGKVIIVADHGMHDTTEGGSHGEFRYEDLYIPYVILDGGK